jgi:hypothetical protein
MTNLFNNSFFTAPIPEDERKRFKLGTGIFDHKLQNYLLHPEHRATVEGQRMAELCDRFNQNHDLEDAEFVELKMFCAQMYYSTATESVPTLFNRVGK